MLPLAKYTFSFLKCNIVFVLKCVQVDEIIMFDVRLNWVYNWILCFHLDNWILVSTRNTEIRNQFQDCIVSDNYHDCFDFLTVVSNFVMFFFLTDLLQTLRFSLTAFTTATTTISNGRSSWTEQKVVLKASSMTTSSLSESATKSF